MPALDRARLVQCYQRVRSALLAERNARGHWEGELSSSALSTATAVMALEMLRRARAARRGPTADSALPDEGGSRAAMIAGGLRWIADRQNADGGWGDTIRSVSNISTTMLCHAAILAGGAVDRYAGVVSAAKAYIDRAGGVPALRARYGKDKTFSIPILTHCALAGLVDWREVAPLPFELACLPAGFYKWARLPVVSYAMPALIAIGQVRHHFVKPRNPLTRLIRGAATDRSRRVLENIQPASGGFLEATPLTSFVTMSLAGMGLDEHPVARKGAEFLARSVRADGSWPIDTNLATWVTTLSIGALGPDLPSEAVATLRQWLLGQQYREVHPYTNADPGGWAWTDLPGGVPDADDTPGAMLALIRLARILGDRPEELATALAAAAGWLLDLQNSDGGWPTFCRGWGTLPFDRSAPDLTAHALRALIARRAFVGRSGISNGVTSRIDRRVDRAITRGFEYLRVAQRPDGSWLPLWFGNQYAPGDENPTYGTARVLAAYIDSGRIGNLPAQRGLESLRRAQNSDDGWGGGQGTPSTVEETALTVEVLVGLERSIDELSESSRRGLEWLLDRTDNEKLMEPSPIGFYFAKLWYFEKLYPVIFAASALRRAVELPDRAPVI